MNYEQTIRDELTLYLPKKIIVYPINQKNQSSDNDALKRVIVNRQLITYNSALKIWIYWQRLLLLFFRSDGKNVENFLASMILFLTQHI